MSAPTISGDAKAALDSGNVLHRAKAYALALEQYRRAAVLAPAEEAPLFGILMVANATNDARLADSATVAMRSRDPAAPRVGAGVTDYHKIAPPSPHPPRPPRKP